MGESIIIFHPSYCTSIPDMCGKERGDEHPDREDTIREEQVVCRKGTDERNGRKN